MEQVRNVNVGRGYEKSSDPLEGLRSAVKTNRTILAIQYLLDIVQSQGERIAALEKAVKSQKSPAPKKAAGKTSEDDAEK